MLEGQADWEEEAADQDRLADEKDAFLPGIVGGLEVLDAQGCVCCFDVLLFLVGDAGEHEGRDDDVGNK